MYIDKKEMPIQILVNTDGLPLVFPGSVAGLYEMHKYAKLPMEKLIQPAMILLKRICYYPAEANLLNSTKKSFLSNNKNATVL